MIIVISDGQENQSKATLDATRNTVLASGAVVYTIDAGDDDSSETGEQGRAVLKSLAASTGGGYFRSAFDGDIGSAFSKIRKDLRSQYAIAYKPSDLMQRRFHDLKIVARNLHVHCRTAYYAK